MIDSISSQVISSDVEVREFRREDILPLVEYWTGNSEEYWRERGIDKHKLKSRAEFTTAYEKQFQERGEILSLATIRFRGQAVGVHSLTDIVERDSAVFHAHIWLERHHRIGIGFFSYLKAADFFFRKLSLKKIYFKTPKLNLGAQRVKEKIGIPALGETVFESPVLISALPATLYVLDSELLQALKLRHGL